MYFRPVSEKDADCCVRLKLTIICIKPTLNGRNGSFLLIFHRLPTKVYRFIMIGLLCACKAGFFDFDPGGTGFLVHFLKN